MKWPILLFKDNIQWTAPHNRHGSTIALFTIQSHGPQKRGSHDSQRKERWKEQKTKTKSFWSSCWGFNKCALGISCFLEKCWHSREKWTGSFHPLVFDFFLFSPGQYLLVLGNWGLRANTSIFHETWPHETSSWTNLCPASEGKCKCQNEGGGVQRKRKILQHVWDNNGPDIFKSWWEVFFCSISWFPNPPSKGAEDNCIKIALPYFNINDYTGNGVVLTTLSLKVW